MKQLCNVHEKLHVLKLVKLESKRNPKPNIKGKLYYIVIIQLDI